MHKRIALVTGANRGLGLETCRQLLARGVAVIMGIRDEARGRDALSSVASLGEAFTVCVDVADEKSISEAVSFIENSFGRLDILVNNAGVFQDSGRQGDLRFASALSVPVETIRQTMEINVYGPLQLIRRAVPLMEKNHYGRIVNVSSGMGQLCEMNGGWPAYRLSKTALNAVTRIFSEELRDKNILVNSVCPGWVRTDMGGESAPRSVEQGADTIVWASLLPDGGPTGSFLRDRKVIGW